MKNTTLKKTEMIFISVILTIINILCLSKFLYTFIEECELIDLMKIVDEAYFSSITTLFKVVLVIIFILSLISLIISLVFLFINHETVSNNLIIINLTILCFVILFFFILRFACGNVLSKDLSYSSEGYLNDRFFNLNLINNAIYIIVSVVLSFVASKVNYKLSCLIHNKNADNVDNGKTSNSDTSLTSEEQVLSEEIAKLKVKIKLKNMQEEYLKLSAELNEDNKKDLHM